MKEDDFVITVDMHDAPPIEIGMLLSDWLPVYEAAGVPYIPIKSLGAPTAGEWSAALDGELKRERSRSDAVIDTMQAAQNVPKGHMARWDCCGGEWLKHLMDYGQPEWVVRADVPESVADMRFYEIMPEIHYLYGENHFIPLWERPWVQAIMVDGYPLEFRVFVSDGIIRGVSSYYPQRPLPDQYLKQANQCMNMTEKLIAHGPNNFTADWLFPENTDRWDSPIIIECGPPHIVEKHWASPCCFKRGEVSGIALKAKPGSDAEKVNERRAIQDLGMADFIVEKDEE